VQAPRTLSRVTSTATRLRVVMSLALREGS
jgi:hypothetical protein